MLFYSLFAQYKQIELFKEKTGEQLLTLLFDNYKPNVVLNYTDARQIMYKEIYNQNDSVFCVYTKYALYLDPSYPNPIDYLSKGGSDNGINCEHTFPQSKGSEIGNARSDMHHLFPARAAVNEARSNFPFTDIDDLKTKKWYFRSSELTSIPKNSIDEYSEGINGFFEPREDHKGNVARAIFYFMTMYDIQADKVFFDTMRNSLCRWHLSDPVDSLEWNRSYQIATYQDNRPNPFVLDCSLPNRTFCENSTSCALADIFNIQLEKMFDITPNPSIGVIALFNYSNFEVNYIELLDYLGQSHYRWETTDYFAKLNIPDNFKGSYLLKIQLRNHYNIYKKVIIN